MLYPLKFEPILKDKIWGGDKLKTIFNKNTTGSNVGESWELSGIEGDESIVVNGFLEGNSLVELCEIYMGELIGDKIYDEFGLSFPLLFKIIDANDNLSIQVHPDNEFAFERHNSHGKTEMWYILDAEPNAELIVGFSENCSKENYLNALKNGAVEDLLKKVKVKKGGVFFIPAGIVHAIGKGILVAEIQQSSDITYRIYDYKRKDDQGIERELHTEQALEVMNFNVSDNTTIDYNDDINKTTELVNCDFFTTNLVHFDQPLIRNYIAIDSFVVYMCLEGDFVIEFNSEKTVVHKGETILIPASIDSLNLIPHSEVRLLEIYISENSKNL